MEESMEDNVVPNISLEVIIGSYEEFLLGYKLVENDEGFQFEQSFTNHAHARSVRCVASNKTMLASGGSDERIQIFNMKKRQEFGTLQHHNGTITSLQFCGPNMFSASEDGTIAIWDAKTFKCKNTLSVNQRKAIDSFAVHPSGKIAASAHKNKKLRMWNVSKGTSAVNLKKSGNIIEWSPKGDFMVLNCESVFKGIVEVFNSKNANDVQKIECNKPVHAITFLSNYLCALGKEDGEAVIYNIKTRKEIKIKKLHESRVKGLKAVVLKTYRGPQRLLFSISSDGYLKAWKLRLKPDNALFKCIAKVNTMCRPTCLTLIIQES